MLKNLLLSLSLLTLVPLLAVAQSDQATYVEADNQQYQSHASEEDEQGRAHATGHGVMEPM